MDTTWAALDLDAGTLEIRQTITRPAHASTAVTSRVYTHMLKGANRTAVDAHAAALFPTLDETGEEDGQDPVTNL